MLPAATPRHDTADDMTGAFRRLLARFRKMRPMTVDGSRLAGLLPSSRLAAVTRSQKIPSGEQTRGEEPRRIHAGRARAARHN